MFKKNITFPERNFCANVTRTESSIPCKNFSSCYRILRSFKVTSVLMLLSLKQTMPRRKLLLN